ncbi:MULTISPECIES: hypothetical protein [unclassified Arthrobacter]|nr:MULTISPECIES: hypothetical protein [unclassified Arthrobacter]
MSGSRFDVSPEADKLLCAVLPLPLRKLPSRYRYAGKTFMSPR